MAEEKNKILKSNFMYGYPNKNKFELIEKTQSMYLESINKFISIFKNDTRCYLSIFNLSTKSEIITNLEKQNRENKLGSAYSQKASHVALDKLHGHFDFIKKKVYGYVKKERKELLPFVSTISVLAACLNYEDSIEAIELAISRELFKLYDKLEKAKLKYFEENNKEKEFMPSKKPEKLKFYEDTLKLLKSIDIEKRKFLEEETRLLFFEKLDNYKTPFVTYSPIPLDSRTCKLSKIDSKSFDYILEVTIAQGLKTKGVSRKIAIPFKTSYRCRKRLSLYKNCQPSIFIDKYNHVKLSVPVEIEREKLKEKSNLIILGCDLGIKKIFSLSNGKVFGTFSGVVSQVYSRLEKYLGNRATLRNTMRIYQKELRRKSTSEDRKKFLREKIFNIARNLNRSKRLRKALNRYSNVATKHISKAIKSLVEYLVSLNSKVLIILEELDINDFKADKRSNQTRSMWPRGEIVKRLKEHFDAIGIEYEFVDPAFTSQVCPICCNIDKNNRKDEKFKCTCCGYEADADVNGGKNILARHSDGEIKKICEDFSWNITLRHQKIKDVYRERNKRYLDINKSTPQGVNGPQCYHFIA